MKGQISPAAAYPEDRPLFSPIHEILNELRAGRMVAVCDDEDRENECDFCMPAQFVAPEFVNFILHEASGYLFLSLTNADCDRLNLHSQCAYNTSPRCTPLKVTINGHPRLGLTSGVSASERAKTIHLCINPNSHPEDFIRPEHINPLPARDGDLLVRNGHTEALVDSYNLPRLRPAALGIEICKADGEMARVPDLIKFCAKHGFKMFSIEALITYRLRSDQLVRRLGSHEGILFETAYGSFRLLTYQIAFDPSPYYLLIKGDIDKRNDAGLLRDSPVLLRIHLLNLFEDVFARLRLGGDQLLSQGRLIEGAMKRITAEGEGVIVLLQQGISAPVPFPTWNTDFQLDWTVAEEPTEDVADAATMYKWQERQIGIGSPILWDLGVNQIRFMTSRECSIPTLRGFGLSVAEYVTDFYR